MRSVPAAMQTTLAGDALRLLRLVEFDFSQGTYRYAIGAPVDVTWNSQTWTARPGTFSELRMNAERLAPTMQLRISNHDGVLGALIDPLVGGSDPRGRRVTVREITEADYADATAVIPDTLVITAWTCARVAVFSLGSPWATGVLVPSRRVGGLRCAWVYKGPDCASVSAEKTCGKIIEDCRARFGTGEALRFSNPPARVRTRRAFFV